MTGLACLALISPAVADEHDTKNLSTVTCKDVLLASGDERDGIVLVLHAYLLGEAKQLTYDADVLAEATDRFFETCIAKPESQALKTLRDELK
jgi:hypothetical protein